MADIKIKDPEEIYNLAMKCNDLFSSYLSGRSNHDRAVEGRQQQFWAWATGLGVFAEHDAAAAEMGHARLEADARSQ